MKFNRRIHNSTEEVFTFILAPMIDVVLFILIFFMISYAKQIGFQNISLPSTSPNSNSKIETTAVLELDKEGILYWRGKPYAESNIQELLDQIDKTKPLILKADKTLTYQNIISNLGFLKKAGVEHILLATYS